MTLLKRLDPKPEFAPREDKPSPERLIEGDPLLKTWTMDEVLAEDAKWKAIKSGVWEATPGVTRSAKGETLEFCHILSGVVELAEEGGETQRFTAGDSFVMKPGFVGRWKTIETVRKVYVVVS